MTETFPAIPASYSSGGQTEVKILSASFGDGYTQDAGDGLNNIRDSWDLIWENLSLANMTTILDFLRARAGTEAFYWTAPDEVSPRKWKCKSWKRNPTGYATGTIRAVFTEDFSL